MRFFIVDAFADSAFGGNPAGVVYLGMNEFPEPELMRRIAAELRYSETAFYRRESGGTLIARYFTPTQEVDLCGHATVGGFWALYEANLLGAGGLFECETAAGVLDVGVDEGGVLMSMAAPKLLRVIDDTADVDALYGVMGLNASDRPEGLAAEIISTGLPDIILPVADEATLARIAPDFPALSRLSEDYGVIGVHAFAQGADGRVHCRNFAPVCGIDEEAATGTANGALGYYLYRHGLLEVGVETAFIQGEAMDRPSRIVCRIEETGGELKVWIGGKAVVLARGELMV